MKKIIVGIILIIIGNVNILSAIICAIPLCSELNSWSGSRLWYILFSSDFLNLGTFFIYSSLLILLGATLCAKEFFDEQHTKKLSWAQWYRNTGRGACLPRPAMISPALCRRRRYNDNTKSFAADRTSMKGGLLFENDKTVVFVFPCGLRGHTIGSPCI